MFSLSFFAIHALQFQMGSEKIDTLMAPAARTYPRSEYPMLLGWLGIWILANLGRFLSVPTIEICFAIALPAATLSVSTLGRAAATDLRAIRYREGLLSIAAGISVFAAVAVTC